MFVPHASETWKKNRMVQSTQNFKLFDNNNKTNKQTNGALKTIFDEA